MFPNTEFFFWSVFTRNWSKYGYSVHVWENTDQIKLRTFNTSRSVLDVFCSLTCGNFHEFTYCFNNATNLSKVKDKVTETLEWFNCCYSWRLKKITLASNVFIIYLGQVFILIIFTLDMQSFRRLLVN